METFDKIVSDIKDERIHQDDKWGSHRKINDFAWITVLMEEVGEVAQAILKHEGDGAIYGELIQVAAVVVAWLECIIEFGNYRQTNSDFKVG